MVDKTDVALHSLREIQTSSLAMGAATSYIFSEIYLQYVEHTAFVDILIQCKILGYFHYVDGILTVYDKTDTDIVNVVQRFDSILTYLLTPWSRILLEKLTGFAANQEIPRILWNNPKVHYRIHKRLVMTNVLMLRISCNDLYLCRGVTYS